jgi:hypothetical protein
MAEQQIVWVTRYALTKGIMTVTGTLSKDGSFVSYRRPGTFYDQYAHGNDWHLTEEAAKERANDMVKRKIASTEKKLAALKSIAF